MPDKPPENTPERPAAHADGETPPFHAIVSHELRTPLSAMLTTLELLGETPLTPQQRDYVDALTQAAESGLRLTELLLSTATLGDGDRADAPARDEFQPSRILGAVQALFQPLADAKGLALSLGAGPGIDHTVLGQPLVLRQAVTALVDNALKYADDGMVSIEAVLDWQGDDGTLEVAIADTGPGIGKAESKRIFAAFARGAAASAVATGHGLGLWITSRLVAAVGGTLRLDETAPRGTRFVMRLPVARPTDGAAASMFEPAAAIPRDPPTLHGARILVVDDSAIIRRLLAACLDGFGVKYILVSSGQGAIDAVHVQRFDAILMDIRMPGMDGFETARCIAATEFGESVPVIGLTANADSLVEEAKRAGGFTAMVAKPFQPADLYRALTEAIFGTD